MGYLDTRDLQSRLEELESEREDFQNTVNDAEEGEEKQTAQEELDSWEGDNLEELEALRELKDEVSEWDDGNTLIPEEDWIDYVEEMLQDCGYLPRNLPWYIEIDWEKTAENIAQDYGTVDYLGTTYYYRY
jgi:predicted nuclease with TOPRIM domain